MRSRKLLVLSLLLALSVWACAGGGETDSPGTVDAGGASNTTTSSAGGPPDTTAPAGNGEPSAPFPGVGGAQTLDSFMPPECVALYVDYLKELEPLSPPTWGAIRVMDDEELDAFVEQVDPVSDRYSETVQDLGCPDYDLLDRLDVVRGMLETARVEVPGALPIIEFMASFFDYYDDIDISTGDCDDDLAMLRQYLGSGKLSDLDARTGHEVTSLTSFLFRNCPDHLAEIRDELDAFGS